MSQNSKDRLFEVADRQQGYFTSQQAEECGLIHLQTIPPSQAEHSSGSLSGHFQHQSWS